MSVALLDVNVLVALANPDHIHHDAAHDWFADHHDGGWATCPLTENGFVRVLSHPQLGTRVERPETLIAMLDRFRRHEHHHFWPEHVSLTDQRIFNRAFIAGPRQLTDIYLLGLAINRKGLLATFDRTIPVGAVLGATKSSLSVIAPAG